VKKEWSVWRPSTWSIFKDKDKKKSVVDRAHVSELGANAQRRGLDEAIAEQIGQITPDMAARIYSRSPYVNAAVRIVAGSLADVPLKVYMKARSGVDKEEKLTGQPYQLLDWGNSFLTKSQLIENTASWLMLCGNAFWTIEKTPDKYKDICPLSVYPLNPRFLKIVPDPETHTRAYIYEVGSEKIWIPEDRVIHFKNFSPLDHWHGHSSLNALEVDIQIERYGKTRLSQYFAQASVLSGVLTMQQDPEDDEIRKIKREFHSQHAGSRNAYRIMVLTNGMEYEPLSTNLGEENSVNILEQSLDIHATVLGVPTPILTGKSQGAKAMIEAEALMWKKTIIPLGTLIAQTITKKLAYPISTRLCVEFDYKKVAALSLLELDRTRVLVAKIMSGHITPNESRINEDLKPYDGDNAEFGDTPSPKWNLDQQALVSPSLSLPGSQGGRDQSDSGEAQMADTTARRMYESMFNEFMKTFLKSED
jgi:HK97 family phage portal protein